MTPAACPEFKTNLRRDFPVSRLIETPSLSCRRHARRWLAGRPSPTPARARSVGACAERNLDSQLLDLEGLLATRNPGAKMTASHNTDGRNNMKQYQTVLNMLTAAVGWLVSVGMNPTDSGPGGRSASQRSDFFGLLDGLLRRREGFFEDILGGRLIGVRLRWFLLAIMLLSGSYGATMGAIGFGVDVQRGLLQMAASAVKVPALYVLSLTICFPVLYVVLVLMGARLTFSQTLSLILLALTLNSVLLASCAPIILFFTVTGSNYNFIKLLHVAIFAFSGCWAMMALWQGLRAMCEKTDLYPRTAIRILQVWILIFGFVGTQMAWSLRPFVGSPDLRFQVFRTGRDGNFYTAVWQSLAGLAPKLGD
jgi:hypothetical protein